MTAESLPYPFDGLSWFTVGDLRAFNARVSSERQKDLLLSNDIRLNRIPWAKQWNEELNPFCILTYCLRLSENCEIRMAPRHAQGIDLFLRADHDISIQMTVADVDWGVHKNPGKVLRWEHELLEANQVVFGGGGTRKKNGALISEPRVIELSEQLAACERGLLRVLKKKLDLNTKLPTVEKADWLGIYCRGFVMQLLDGGEERLERALVDLSATHPQFERVFIFDATAHQTFLKSWSRPDAKPIGSICSPTSLPYDGIDVSQPAR